MLRSHHFRDIIFARVQIPQPDDSHSPIARVQDSAPIRDRRAFVPYDISQMVRHLGRVEHDAAHAVNHVQ